MNNQCLFCKIISGDIPAAKVYENDKVLAFLDINPVNTGHTLIIPKEHYPNTLETSDEALAELISSVKLIAPAIMKGVGAPAFNLAVNNGKESGQVIHHTHFHIIPRFPDDGHRHWPGKSYDEGEAERIAGLIKANL